MSKFFDLSIFEKEVKIERADPNEVARVQEILRNPSRSSQRDEPTKEIRKAESVASSSTRSVKGMSVTLTVESVEKEIKYLTGLFDEDGADFEKLIADLERLNKLKKDLESERSNSSSSSFRKPVSSNVLDEETLSRHVRQMEIDECSSVHSRSGREQGTFLFGGNNFEPVDQDRRSTMSQRGLESTGFRTFQTSVETKSDVSSTRYSQRSKVETKRETSPARSNRSVVSDVTTASTKIESILGKEHTRVFESNLVLSDGKIMDETRINVADDHGVTPYEYYYFAVGKLVQNSGPVAKLEIFAVWFELYSEYKLYLDEVVKFGGNRTAALFLDEFLKTYDIFIGNVKGKKALDVLPMYKKYMKMYFDMFKDRYTVHSEILVFEEFLTWV